MRSWKICLGFSVFISIIAHADVSALYLSKVEDIAREKIENKASEIPILIYLKKVADLRGADFLTTKSQKGRFVVDSLRSVALESQADLINTLETNKIQYRQFYIVNMVSIPHATPDLIKLLVERDDIERIDYDKKIVLQRPFAMSLEEDPAPPPRMKIEANISATNAPWFWDKYKTKGAGIVVGGQDTGVDWDHPALKHHYRGTTNSGINHDYNWLDAIDEPIKESNVKDGTNPCGWSSPEPCDDSAHGTHTIGTVVGQTEDMYTIGVAPDAKWIACRNMDEGEGRAWSYLRCLEFFLAPYPVGGDPLRDGRPDLAPHVTNNSWGCPKSEKCKGHEFADALLRQKLAGIMTVASAGNRGPGCSTIDDGPAHHSYLTLSVGALDHRTGRIAPFSSRGPSLYDNALGPDVAAPGVNIRSALPGGGYSGATWSGTSMAGPHVAGQVALIWAANPKLIGNIDRTVQLIRNSAIETSDPLECGGIPGDHHPNNVYGWGFMDMLKL
jgi:serine protease AprX